MAKWVKAAAVSEIPPGKAKLVEAEGLQIALFNVGGTFYAIDNACTHVGGLAGGGFRGGRAGGVPVARGPFQCEDGAGPFGPGGSRRGRL